MTIKEKYDIIIVGGGPAGMAFARTFKDKKTDTKILLLEKYKYPRDKICGDALSHLSLSLVQSIFPELKDHFPSKNITKRYTLWYPNGKFISRNIQHFDIVPRKTFDAWLWDTIQDNSVDIMEEAPVTDLLFDAGEVKGVKLSHNGKDMTIQADLVIGADGSNSLIRRKTDSTAQDNIIRCVRQYVKGIPPTDDGLIFLLDAENFGYFWIFPFYMEGQWWANIGCGNKKMNPQDQFRTFCQNPIVQKYIDKAELQGGLKVFPLNLAAVTFNKINISRPLWGQGYLLLGDAAGLNHPYTGEGISVALYSGKLAAELYSSGLSQRELGETYQKNMLTYVRSPFDMFHNALMFIVPCHLPGPFRKWYMTFYPWLQGMK